MLRSDLPVPILAGKNRLLPLSSRPCLRTWRLMSRKTRKGSQFFLAKVGKGLSVAPFPYHFLSPHLCSSIPTIAQGGYPRVVLQD